MTTELARLQNFGPNWFAAVMGTGIVATARGTLAVHLPGLRGFAHVVWVVAAGLLILLIVAVTVQWARHPTIARSHARNPQMTHFYGAAPMALMTVAAGALLSGIRTPTLPSHPAWPAACTFRSSVRRGRRVRRCWGVGTGRRADRPRQPVRAERLGKVGTPC
jgi:tellurite resistance protein TehA-like permease